MVRGPVGTVCILLLSNHAGVSDCFMIRQNVAILGNRSSDETPAYNDQGCTLSCIEWWSPKCNSSFHKNRCIYRYKIWISESTRIAIVGILAGLIHWYTWGTSMNLQLSARKTTTMTTATTTTTSMERVGVKRSSRARKENDLNMTLMCRNLSEENIIRTRNLKLSFGKVNQLMGHLRIGHEAGRLLMIAQEYGSNEAPTSDIPTYSTLNWYIMYANVVSLVYNNVSPDASINTRLVRGHLQLRGAQPGRCFPSFSACVKAWHWKSRHGGHRPDTEVTGERGCPMVSVNKWRHAAFDVFGVSTRRTGGKISLQYSERISRVHANRVHASTLQILCFRAEWPDPSSSENSTGSSAAVLQAIFAERRKNPLLSSFQTFCVKQAKKTIDKGFVDYRRVPGKYASNFWGY